jgi:hypothetical protein
MPKRPLLALGVLVVLLGSSYSSIANAQTVRTRILRGFELRRRATWEIEVQFNVPVRYLRHAPVERGDALRIQLDVLRVGRSDVPAFAGRESLAVPRELPVPLLEVTYEGNAVDAPALAIRFSRRVRFTVRQGRDLRSLVIAVQEDGVRKQTGGPRAPRPPGLSLPELPTDQAEEELPPEPAGSDAARARDLVAEGRRAMTLGEHDRAILLFTTALSLPESRSSREARELLGLARERNGQLAHAKAEYEEYLRLYPEGEGAARVQQRLDALLTARAEPPEPRRKPPPRDVEPWEIDSFGSLYGAYRRESRFDAVIGEALLDSSLLVDFFGRTRLRRGELTVNGESSGGYRYDFLDDGSGQETRISSLFVDVAHNRSGLSGSLGRRSSSSGGVLGRYDGARIGYRLGERFELGLVAGLPVESPTDHGIDLERYFGGINLGFQGFADGLDGELFYVHQQIGAVVDRSAIGGEARYFNDGRFAAAFVDFDVYFQSLNIAQLLGNWQLTPRTFLNGLVDYRNSPILTTYNALVGQPVRSFDGLTSLFTSSQLRSLASDRTAHSLTLSLGGSHQLDDHLQVALDWSATDLSGTPASGGVDAIAGTGFEFAYQAQLIANGVVQPGDAIVGGVRFFDGSRADVATLTLDSRHPITPELRLNPSLRFDYRFSEDQADVTTTRPSLRVEYRFWKLMLELEGGGEWLKRIGEDNEWGYFFGVGLRHDF